MRTAMVVASNRSESLNQFLTAWQPYPWDVTIVVDDTGSRMDIGPVDAHYTWEDIDKLPNIFSRKDAGIKTFGFLQALVAHDADAVLVLDDDCLPATKPHSQFVQQHIAALQCGRWQTTVPGYRVRGMPYYEADSQIHACVNVGLWCGVADIDAMTALTMPEMRKIAMLPDGTTLRHPQQYIPMCGMNLFFTKDIAPAMYFPRMGVAQPYSRFDDIWAGIVVEKVLSFCGREMTYGSPYVKHMGASNVLRNLCRESPGYAANEVFWRVVDDLPIARTATTIADVVRAIADGFLTVGDSVISHTGCDADVRNFLSEKQDCELASYIRQYGECLILWLQLLQAASLGRSKEWQIYQ